MEGAPRRSLGSQAQHLHSLEDHTWSIQQCTFTHTKLFHNFQQQNSNYSQTHCELFHQTIHKHATHKPNGSINRATQHIQGYNITLTTSHVQEAIKQLHASQYNKNTTSSTSHTQTHNILQHSKAQQLTIVNNGR